MGSQFRDLKAKATHLLGLHRKGKPPATHTSDIMLEEIMTHLLVCEMQNIHLKEMQDKPIPSTQQYQLLYEMAPISYFTLDDKGLISSVNEAGAVLLGVNSAATLRQRAFSRYVAPQSQLAYSEFYQSTFKQDEPITCELKLLKRGEAVFTAKLTGIVMTETSAPQLLLTITDISHDVAAASKVHKHQANLSNTDRKSATREMAQILSTDLKQPLGVIANYLHGSLRRLEDKHCDLEQIKLALKQSILQLNRATDIIALINNLNCKQATNLQLTSLDKLIREIIELINYEFNDFPFTINYKSNHALPKIFIDELYIQQALLHLTRNALESMRDANTENARLTIQIIQTSVNEVEVLIADNGPGFDTNNAHQLFQPNYTTKPYGMGLGLLASRIIIETHGGKLYADQEAIYGASFKFTLPVHQG